MSKVLEERIGFNMIHPGIIKQSVFLNLLDIEAKIREAENLKEKNDAYEVILFFSLKKKNCLVFYNNLFL